MRNLHLLGRKLLKREPIENKQDRENSTEQSVLSPPEQTTIKCPEFRNFEVYCSECEDRRTFEVVEVIENGNLEHGYKCLKCGVILGDELSFGDEQ